MSEGGTEGSEGGRREDRSEGERMWRDGKGRESVGGFITCSIYVGLQ